MPKIDYQRSTHTDIQVDCIHFVRTWSLWLHKCYDLKHNPIYSEIPLTLQKRARNDVTKALRRGYSVERQYEGAPLLAALLDIFSSSKLRGGITVRSPKYVDCYGVEHDLQWVTEWPVDDYRKYVCTLHTPLIWTVKYANTIVAILELLRCGNSYTVRQAIAHADARKDGVMNLLFAEATSELPEGSLLFYNDTRGLHTSMATFLQGLGITHEYELPVRNSGSQYVQSSSAIAESIGVGASPD